MDYLESLRGIIFLNQADSTKAITYCVVLFILIALSSFFSASETAVSTANKVRLKLLADDKVKGARKALNIIDKFDKTLSTILIGNNLVNIASGTLGLLIVKLFVESEDLASLLSTLLITIIVLICGEILPKSFAKANPEAVILKISGIVYFLNIVFTPLSFIFQKMKHALFKDKAEIDDVTTEDELEVILDNMEERGVIHEDEVDLIENVLNLNDITVSDIMTHRVDIIAFEVKEDIEAIKELFFTSKYSRIPVYEDDKDNIIGVLYERDFFTKLIKNEKIYIRELLREVKYVSKSMKVDVLIHTLQQANMHMAIVSDEYGGTDGLVTLEDALEEIVGEIYDEHDDSQAVIFEELEDGSYLVDAEMEVEDLFDRFGIGKYPETAYNKVGGWLYEMSEGIPEIGAQINYTCSYSSYSDVEDTYYNYESILEFTIKDVDERRIISTTVKVTTNVIEE